MKKTVRITSKRNSEIVADIYEGNGNRNGLLIMAHSFKSERSEDGRFSFLANDLTDCNITTIAMDFPGNGESSETMKEYCLDNCLDDMESCYQYIKDNYDIDESRLGLLGYSMGGRLISLFLKKHPEFSTLIFWAACNRNYSENDVFLEQPFHKLKEEADQKGYCIFHDIFSNCDDVMSKQFVDNMLEYDALKPLHDFKGNALIIQGEKDITIEVENGRWIFDALRSCENKELYFMHEADHGFGLWDGRKADNERLLSLSSVYLKKFM